MSKEVAKIDLESVTEDAQRICVDAYLFFKKYIQPLKKSTALDTPVLRCAKCGRADISTRYCYESGDAINCDKDHDGEILHHFCKVCGYKWDSPTIDTKV
jgi:hypothetical protein